MSNALPTNAGLRALRAAHADGRIYSGSADAPAHVLRSLDRAGLVRHVKTEVVECHGRSGTGFYGRGYRSISSTYEITDAGRAAIGSAS